MYDRKTDTRRFDTNLSIQRPLSLTVSALKGARPPIWRHQEPTERRRSGTDGLSDKGYFHSKP